MHEVGHTLGLRHNFKASTMLKNEQLHDTAITRKQGLVGSVMDYAPVNMAPKGVKQGDYFTTTIGPYDYWAIEYAYKPLSRRHRRRGATNCRRSPASAPLPGHDYATDEDLYGTADPLINVWDLGSRPDEVRPGADAAGARNCSRAWRTASWTRARAISACVMAFGMLLGQYGNAAHLMSPTTSAASTCTATTPATRAAAIRWCRSRAPSSARR